MVDASDEGPWRSVRLHAIGFEPLTRDLPSREDDDQAARFIDELVRDLGNHVAARIGVKPMASVSKSEMVDAMRAEVHAAARKDVDQPTDGRPPTEMERRGYNWSFKVGRVADMLEYLTRTIREDIGFEEGATLASMLLLDKAILHLDVELQDGGSDGGRDDREENRLRVLDALKALTPEFDNVNMQRLRALHVAERSAQITRVLSDADVEESAKKLAQLDARHLDKHRDYMKNEQPVISGLLARNWLVEVDRAFESLDPLVVLEEFAEAEAATRGGRSDRGDGKVGPARALARLAVMCGALGYAARPDEDFDTAVDRARGNLLMTRSRARKTLRDFPGELPPDAVDDEEGEG
jgi:hypothetical protein